MSSSLVQRLRDPHTVLSVEFFPPKTPEAEAQFLEAAKRIAELGTDFASITYGAGGSTRERTLRYASSLQDDLGFTVMPHLTCVGHSRDELHTLVAELAARRFPAIMALRGDPPKGQANFQPHPDGLRYGSDLVTLIRTAYPQFEIGVGGYPEKHPEASDLKTDLEHLGTKLDAGADFITTQLFLDNSVYAHFVSAIRNLGYDHPVLPGVLIPLSLEQLRRFAGFCGTTIPTDLESRLLDAGEDPDSQLAAGIDWAVEQATDLVARGAPGIHLYVLNRAGPAIQLVERLRADGILKS